MCIIGLLGLERPCQDDDVLLRLKSRGGTFKWSLSAGGLALPGTAPASVTVRLVIGDDCFGSTVPCAGGASSVTCR